MSLKYFLLFSFSSNISGLGPPPSTGGHLYLHHHHLNNQSSGSPDFLSDDEEEISNWDVNGSGINGHNGAPEIQGKQTNQFFTCREWSVFLPSSPFLKANINGLKSCTYSLAVKRILLVFFFKYSISKTSAKLI